MTPAELEAIKARCDVAMLSDDWDLDVSSACDVPTLLAEVERLREFNDAAILANEGLGDSLVILAEENERLAEFEAILRDAAEGLGESVVYFGKRAAAWKAAAKAQRAEVARLEAVVDIQLQGRILDVARLQAAHAGYEAKVWAAYERRFENNERVCAELRKENERLRAGEL